MTSTPHDLLSVAGVLSVSRARTLADAAGRANRNGAPVQVWERYGWYAISELPDDEYEIHPVSQGWHDVAIIEPSGDVR